MNIDGLKKLIKSNPHMECVYMCLQSLKNDKIAREMIGTKRNPNNLIVQRYGCINIDKVIYHIYFNEDARFNGFCSLYRMVLMHLAYAEDMLLIPVVFWGNRTLYYDETIENCNNAFEYYFNPVSDVNYKDVLSSNKVVVSKGADAGLFGTTGCYFISEDEISFLATYQRKYMKLKDEVKELFWNELEEILDGGKTLGVHVRATDFNKGYNRHPVVVSPQEYLERTKVIFNKNGYEKVFLATDDENIISLFLEVFKNKLYYYKNTYRSTDGEAIHYGTKYPVREHHKFKLGLEIIKDFYTLGYCDGLIAGNSNVSICSRIIKKGLGECYRTMDIIDKGVNHNMHETRSKFNSMLKEEKK